MPPVERPILMDTVSVQGLLDNRKTQTRRVMRDAPGGDPRDDGYASTILARCPYGQPGDRLWVRESFRHFGNKHHAGQSWALVEYRAGGVLEIPFGEAIPPERAWWKTNRKPWTAGILMPRWASRALLELVEVRFQPLQAISHVDCRAEGVIATPFWGGDVDWEAIRADQARPMRVPPDGQSEGDEINQGWMDYVRGVFIKRWDSINSGRGHAWTGNPWVWAVSFSVLELKARPPQPFYLEEIALEQAQGSRA